MAFKYSILWQHMSLQCIPYQNSTIILLDTINLIKTLLHLRSKELPSSYSDYIRMLFKLHVGRNYINVDAKSIVLLINAYMISIHDLDL